VTPEAVFSIEAFSRHHGRIDDLYREVGKLVAGDTPELADAIEAASQGVANPVKPVRRRVGCFIPTS